MKKNKVKKENPPARLLWTMFLLVLGMVIVYGTLVLGIFALVQRLVRLDESNYTLVWPILFLTVSAILGVALAVFIFRGYLAPLSRLMQAIRLRSYGSSQGEMSRANTVMTSFAPGPRRLLNERTSPVTHTII